MAAPAPVFGRKTAEAVASTAVRTSSVRAPYTLRVRFTKTQLHLQLTLAPASSPLWRNYPQYAMKPTQSSLPRSFAPALPLRSSTDLDAGQPLLSVPPTLLYSDRPKGEGLAAELGGRPVLSVSPGTVGFFNSKSRLPEALRETCFAFFKQFNELVRRSERGQEMPIVERRPSPHGLARSDNQKWDPSLRPTKPFVPPVPAEVEIVLNGWRLGTLVPTFATSLESPQAFELRKRVVHVRDETVIPCCAGRPRRKRVI